MKKRLAFLFAIFGFAVLIGVAIYFYGKLSENYAVQPAAAQQGVAENGGENTPQERIAAPDFVVYNGDGDEVRFSDYSGKPAVLNFWASWCQPCRVELPDFEAVYSEKKDEVEFFMINATDGRSETQSKASAFIEENSYTFPVYYDKDYSAINGYGITAYPVTVYVDAEGYIYNVHMGILSAESLLAVIDEMM